jgi:hypothetical protein
MTVPLPDGTSALMPTLPPTTASLMLGIWFGPASQGTKHVAKMCLKGIDWARPTLLQASPTFRSMDQLYISTVSGNVMGYFNHRPFTS